MSNNLTYSSNDLMILIAKNGTYFCPANKHYNSQTTNVICDRCKRTGLNACIGYDKYDLCLSCADKVTQQLNPSPSSPKFAETNPFTPNVPVAPTAPVAPIVQHKPRPIMSPFNYPQQPPNSNFLQMHTNPVKSGIYGSNQMTKEPQENTPSYVGDCPKGTNPIFQFPTNAFAETTSFPAFNVPDSKDGIFPFPRPIATAAAAPIAPFGSNLSNAF